MERALTVGVIAEKLGCAVHRVEYLIRARKIEPIIRAGNSRVFDNRAVELLRQEIAKHTTAAA